MKSYRVRIFRDPEFPLLLTKQRIEVQDQPRGRWQEWLGPFDENWMPGAGMLYVGQHRTQLVDRTGRTSWGRTSDAVTTAA